MSKKTKKTKADQGVFEGKMRWLATDFDGRAEDENSPELFGNFSCLAELGALDRMLEESCDVFVVRRDVLDPVTVKEWEQESQEAGFQIQRDEDEIEEATLHNVVTKMIVRRPGENVPWNDPRDLDPDAVLAKLRSMQDATEGDRYSTMSLEDLESDDPDEVSPLDALAHAESLQDVAEGEDTEIDLEHAAAAIRVDAPKDRWDLVRDESAQNEEDHYSADIYPHRADKCLRGYAHNLSKAIDHGMSRKALFLALAEANPVSAAKYQMQQKLQDAARAKLSAEKLEELRTNWEHYIERFAKKHEDRVPGVYVARLWEQIREREEQREFLENPEVYKRRAANKLRSIKEQSSKRS